MLLEPSTMNLFHSLVTVFYKFSMIVNILVSGIKTSIEGSSAKTM